MKESYIWLIKVFGYANPIVTELLERFGSAKEIYSAFKSNIAAAGAEYAIAAEKTSLESAAEILDGLESKSVTTITIEDELYPETLRNSENPPCVIFALGNTGLLNNKLISVTGSRKITDYVVKAETAICEKLCENYTLVASMTAGCEQLACITASGLGKGCIEIMPCGFACEYPKGSRVLRQRLLMNGGCIISEFLPDVRSSNANFLRRARIFGTISKAMIVFQAGVNSGSLNAAKYSPALFFLPPNNIFAKEYAGAVQCVRNGAHLYLSEEDIHHVFSDDFSPYKVEIKKAKQEKKSPAPQKDINEKSPTESIKPPAEIEETPLHHSVLAQIVKAGKPITFDEIYRNEDTDISTLNEVLFDLEILEKINAVPGSRYVLRN